jgi:nicotinate phosphoribosyltransferase
VAVARAAYVAGFSSTSNLAAGYTYGVPTVGTAAHAFTLAHKDEIAAFSSQVKAHGPGTTLLVDTYDIAQGIRNAVQVAGTSLGAIRIDSGDLDEEARKARVLLDELGATNTRITVTSDLDEYLIEHLSTAPIDGYGVGTRVATGSGHPTAGMVYKLVAVADHPGADAPLRPVAKKATGKASLGGRKVAYRAIGSNGLAAKETLVIRHVDDATEGFPGRRLQIKAMERGRIVHNPTLDEVRAHHAAARAELPIDALVLSDGDAVLTATL